MEIWYLSIQLLTASHAAHVAIFSSSELLVSPGSCSSELSRRDKVWRRRKTQLRKNLEESCYQNCEDLACKCRCENESNKAYFSVFSHFPFQKSIAVSETRCMLLHHQWRQLNSYVSSLPSLHCPLELITNDGAPHKWHQIEVLVFPDFRVSSLFAFPGGAYQRKIMLVSFIAYAYQVQLESFWKDKLLVWKKWV